MTIQECYQALGGDYTAVVKRLMSENLVKRFITKFLSDASYTQLCQAMDSGDRETAFRASHTLKGVSANLGFDALCRSSSDLTELLRPEGAVINPEAMRLLEQVKKDYAGTVQAISTYLGLG